MASTNMARLRALTQKLDKRNTPVTFFDMSLDMMCIVKTDGTIKKVNQSLQDSLGWSLDELKDKSLSDLVHADDVKQTKSECSKLKTLGESLYFRNRILTKNGEYKILCWTVKLRGDLAYCVARDFLKMMDTVSK